jgi:hypothetical protein
VISSHNRLFGLAAAALLAFSGCGKDDEGSEDSGPVGPGDNISVEIAQGTIHINALGHGEFPGWVGVPNLDDDDQDGTADFEQAGATGENDLTQAWLDTQGRQVKLALSGTTSAIRVYQGDKPILGQGQSQEALIEGSEELVSLQLEFSDFLVGGQLSVTDVEKETRFTIDLTSSPLILNHHLQAAEEVMSMRVHYQGYSSKSMVDDYKAALGKNRFITVDGDTYGGDVWVQDEFEFGYMNAPGAHVDFIFDTLRNGQVDGVSYPFGRIYYGGASGYMPKKQTRQALNAMQIQKPFLADSTWLCVGHVDEFTSTIPDPSAPKGFRFVIADTRSAWEVINKMDPSTELPKWAPGGYAGHSIDTVGEIQNDNALEALNREVQDILDEQLELFKKELGLNEEDIIYMPSLFEEPQGCGQFLAALIPGMTNLIVAEDKNGDPAIFLADPFLRENKNDQSTDPMIEEVRKRFPASLNLHFLDDWTVYHMGLGEVHCGSNVKRETTTEWWTEGAHLLSIEGGE